MSLLFLEPAAKAKHEPCSNRTEKANAELRRVNSSLDIPLSYVIILNIYPKLLKVNNQKMDFNKLANKQIVDDTLKELRDRGYQAFTVENGKKALEKIKELIPSNASVTNGASRTLEQIGFVDYLKSGNHSWNNLHENILKEIDPAKQKLLRRQSAVSDYYLGSVHALIETGDFIIASNTGSQLSPIVFTSENLIFVVSTKKIVPSIEIGMKRLIDHVIPLEDKNMMQKYNIGTSLNKIVIFKGESKFNQRKITFILVNENLGF